MSDSTKEQSIFMAADERVNFMSPSTTPPCDWTELKPPVVGAIIASVLRDAKRTPHTVTPGAQVFARFYSLPALTEALAGVGR